MVINKLLSLWYKMMIILNLFLTDKYLEYGKI